MRNSRAEPSSARGVPWHTACSLGARTLALAVAMWPLPVVAQEQTADLATVDLELIDRSSGSPLAGASVRIPELGIYLSADSLGVVRIEEIAIGSYDMVVSAPGYSEIRGRFTVDRDGTFQIGLDASANIRLVGRVVTQEDDTPLAGAIVRLEGIAPALTDDEGRFQIEKVAPGRVAFDVEYLGRSPLTDTLVLEPAELVAVVIRLEDTPIPLEGLEVVVEPRSLGLESAGFYDRRDRWLLTGVRFTREDLEDHPRAQLSDYMFNIPGSRVVRSGFTALLKVTRYGNECDPITFVDGVRMGAAYDLNALPPDAIEGVEVYVGQRAPIQFQSAAGGGCGTVLIWTRAYR